MTRKFERESDVEAYLVERVKALGGEIRKVQWIGRNGAPDRLVMLPMRETMDGRMDKPARTLWIECKAPGLAATFPSNPHERAQAREHKRMRAVGQQVFVVDSPEGVDEVLGGP
jgi:hypothetical protein